MNIIIQLEGRGGGAFSVPKTLSSSSSDSSEVVEALDLISFNARRSCLSALVFMVCNLTRKPESWKVYSLNNPRKMVSSEAFVCVA